MTSCINDIEFRCIADKCAHSCCKGWEIDIDDETYELYRGIPGEVGEKIRAAIKSEEIAEELAQDGLGGVVTHHFVLTEDERCPFLNENNLCDIILKLGEDYLCDICREHPRFYKELDNGEYACGYGLCCEEAARLTLFPPEDKEDDCYNGELADFAGTDCESSNSEKVDFEKTAKLCKLLVVLESIEPYWIQNVRELVLVFEEGTDEEIEKSVSLRDEVLAEYGTAFGHLQDYMMFRYDSKEYAAYMCAVIALICGMIKGKKGDFAPEDLIEIVRVYSADIEYSDENVEKILAALK